MQKVLGVRFKDAGKIYYFEPWPEDLKPKEKVIVETANGVEIAEVALPNHRINENELSASLKPILRKATKEDIEKFNQNLVKAEKNVSVVKSKVKSLGLDMNIVNLEYSLDGNKVVINFTSENRVDFRDLLKELGSALKARIELRQIGARDETKILGGLGPCGKACCCKRFLQDFEHVSVKMAKNQNLSLNPTKISGLCGRLMCCLGYENQYYADTLKRIPRPGNTIKMPEGDGVVVSADILRQRIGIKFLKKDDSSLIKEFSLDEIENFKTEAPSYTQPHSEKFSNEEKASEKPQRGSGKRSFPKSHNKNKNGDKNGIQNK